MIQGSPTISDGEKLKISLEKAKGIYSVHSELHCPYLGIKVSLTSDGFNHLQNKPNRLPRNVKEQIVKLTLLKRAISIIPKCGTLQEFREKNEKIGKKGTDGFYKMKNVRYWGFHAILDDKKHKIKVILKQVGDGKIIFWSVMPFDQRLYAIGIDEN